MRENERDVKKWVVVVVVKMSEGVWVCGVNVCVMILMKEWSDVQNRGGGKLSWGWDEGYMSVSRVGHVLQSSGDEERSLAADDVFCWYL